jgi:hypothetical protein
MRRFLIAALVLCGAALGGGLFLFKKYTAVFPELSPGVYVGTIERGEQGLVVPWYVVRYEGEHSLGVSIGDVRIAAQRVAPVDPSGKTRLPLTIGDSTIRLKFTGTRAEQPNSYEGRYFNPISNEKGKWRLSKVSPESASIKTDQDLVRWFSLWQEVERIEEQILASQRSADEQRAKIENLHKYVADGDTLRKTADVRLGRTDSALSSAIDELGLRQAQLDRSLRDFDLSQRISQEGKLVFLSRETLQRESRWIELTLELLAPETSIGFEQAFERAERVRSLKASIIQERKGIMKQAADERPRKEGSEERAEEEFYEHLQQQ